MGLISQLDQALSIEELNSLNQVTSFLLKKQDLVWHTVQFLRPHTYHISLSYFTKDNIIEEEKLKIQE